MHMFKWCISEWVMDLEKSVYEWIYFTAQSEPVLWEYELARHMYLHACVYESVYLCLSGGVGGFIR